MPLEAGTILGHYEIISPLGSGGMGEVYRAKDTRLKRDVAVKVVTERLAKDHNAINHFEREAQAVAALSHPNIISIHDFGTDQGVTYIVMELLEGETLRARIKHSTIPRRKAIELGIKISDGLAAAHAKGIIHRDLKPENVFLTNDGEVKILDFGLARTEPIKSSEDLTVSLYTKPGTVLGTICYMSPEQVRGQVVDVRSDIFSFGCVLHEMLTGNRTFKGDTSADVTAAILTHDPESITETDSNVMSELDRTIMRCLEKNPRRRFQSSNDLSFMLQNILTGTGLPQPDEQSAHGSLANDDRPSIAILPFVNMSADAENEYFSDGLSEELINGLCKIQGLQVASRTSAFAFKGKNQDIRSIGDRLNVKTILEGSVRKAGNRLRITAQLVNVADGYHLWSETFDRQMEDIFAVQDEIAQSITRALRVVLTEKEKFAIAKAPTDNVQAYEYYLRGRQFSYQFRRKGLERARKLFIRAYELDPEYASAYAGVADCCSLLFLYFEASEATLKEANDASLKALELDPELAEAHVSYGYALSLNKRFDDAQREFETAIQQNPELFEAYYFYARACFAQGKLEQAAHLFKQACHVRPEDYSAPSLLSNVYVGLDCKNELVDASRRTLEAAEKHLEVYPEEGRALYMGAHALIQLGKHERGLEWAMRAFENNPEESAVNYNVACTYAQLGHVEKGIDYLDKAITLGFQHKEWIENDPYLNSMRSHPRFQAILERL